MMDANLLLALARLAPTKVPVVDGDVYFDAAAAAEILRSEKVLAGVTKNLISTHLSGLQSARSVGRAIEAYDRAYLLNLPLSYTGISQLCSAFIAVAKTYKVSVPSVWQEFAASKFDWDSEVETLTRMDTF